MTAHATKDFWMTPQVKVDVGATFTHACNMCYTTFFQSHKGSAFQQCMGQRIIVAKHVQVRW